MQIIETNLFKLPETLFLMLKEGFLPYPTTNATVYALYDKNKLVSFCAIKKWKKTTELSMIITKKPYRNKGYATKLLTKILKNHKKLYLMTTEELTPFYGRFGFKKTTKAPKIIEYRVISANYLRKTIQMKPLVMMKR